MNEKDRAYYTVEKSDLFAVARLAVIGGRRTADAVADEVLSALSRLLNISIEELREHYAGTMDKVAAKALRSLRYEAPTIPFF